MTTSLHTEITCGDIVEASTVLQFIGATPNPLAANLVAIRERQLTAQSKRRAVKDAFKLFARETKSSNINLELLSANNNVSLGKDEQKEAVVTSDTVTQGARTANDLPVQASTTNKVEAVLAENVRLKAKVQELQQSLEIIRKRRLLDGSDSFDGRKALLLKEKLLRLKVNEEIGFYEAETKGRNAPHPDYWVVSQLQPLVDSGKLAEQELLLALEHPGVWFTVDERLYLAKKKRNERGSASNPLAELKAKLQGLSQPGRRSPKVVVQQELRRSVVA
jgi:hypothetical protein